MSEQQGWAPNPADQQGWASSPAAQPTTTPADTAPGATSSEDTTEPATTPVTPPGIMPAGLPSVAMTPDTAPAASPADLPGAAPFTSPAGAPFASPTGLSGVAMTPAAAPVTPPAAAPVTSPGAAPAGLPGAGPAMTPANLPTSAESAAVMPVYPMSHDSHAWPTNPAAPVTGAGDMQAEAATTWPAAQHAAPAAPERRPAVEGPIQTWPASQHAAPQAGNTAAQGTPYTAQGGLHAAPGSNLHASQGGLHAASGDLHAASGDLHAAPGGDLHASAQGGPHPAPGTLHAPTGNPHAAPGSNLHAAQGGLHAASGGNPHPGAQGGGLHAYGQAGNPQSQFGAGGDPRFWGAAAGAGQGQPHLPNAQLPPHVPHMQRPPQWAQQQPGSVFVAPAVRRRSRVGLAVAGIVAAVGLSAVSAFGGGLAALELRPEKSNTVVGATNSSGSSAGATTTLSDVAAQVLPSVVSISTGNAVGSGVVITDDGAILTNNHVVATARGTTVQVTFSSGQSVQAKIVGTEPTSDLAVIKIVGGGTYTPLAFGDSSTVKVGDTVLAVGSPLGLDGSVTAGIVSAVNRTIDEGQDGQSAAAKITGAIQTDAAINPGNSGGALVNTAGQLVGINTAIATSGETAGNIGVGFAISSNTAKAVAQRLLS